MADLLVTGAAILIGLVAAAAAVDDPPLRIAVGVGCWVIAAEMLFRLVRDVRGRR